MDQHGFDWIAIVQVENYETSRAKEVAEIAVDLSLAVLQDARSPRQKHCEGNRSYSSPD
jgi:hypothetical protein